MSDIQDMGARTPKPLDFMRMAVARTFHDSSVVVRMAPSEVLTVIYSSIDNLERDLDDISLACLNAREVLLYKNGNYGNSALEPLRIYSKSEEPTYLSRIDEKLARIKSSDKLRKNDVWDMIGYNILAVIDNDWHRNVSDLFD